MVAGTSNEDAARESDLTTHAATPWS